MKTTKKIVNWSISNIDLLTSITILSMCFLSLVSLFVVDFVPVREHW